MSDDSTQQDAVETTEQNDAAGDAKTFDETYVKKLRDEAAGYRVKLKEYEDRDKTASEKDAERITELERENAQFKAQSERALWIRDAAKEAAISVETAELLAGDSYEAILAGAKQFKSLIPEQQNGVRAGAENDSMALNGDGIEDALRKALGA